VIPTNVANLDGDNIPDFADGFDAFGDTSDDDLITGDRKPHFIPMSLELSDNLRQEDVMFSFEYTASNPADLQKGNKIGETKNGKDVYGYTVPPGFRLWKTNNGNRNKKPVSESGGDFVPANGESAGDGSDAPSRYPLDMNESFSALSVAKNPIYRLLGLFLAYRIAKNEKDLLDFYEKYLDESDMQIRHEVLWEVSNMAGDASKNLLQKMKEKWGITLEEDDK
jgi:hypothetical protein